MAGAEWPPPCQLHSAWNLGNLNDRNKALEPRQQNMLSSFPSSHFLTSNVEFTEPSLCVKPGSKDQANGFYMFPNLPYCDASPWPKTGSFMRGSQNALSDLYGVNATPNIVAPPGQKRKPTPMTAKRYGVNATPKNVVTSCQKSIPTPLVATKQFLVFDRSGEETRMILSAFPPLAQNQITLAKRSFDAYNVRDEIVGVEKMSTMKFFNQEDADENSIVGEESEMHEDTEEINALLYSDNSDDDHYGSDNEDDEVKSTGQSPLKVGGEYEIGEISEDFDEVASSDFSNKRQKFVDGGYKNLSLMGGANSLKLIRSSSYDENDAESSCGVQKNPTPDVESVPSAWEKKAKIRKTLKVLEEMVVGLKGNDPLLVIDGAIDYLKGLRLKAESLGICYSQVHNPLPLSRRREAGVPSDSC